MLYKNLNSSQADYSAPFMGKLIVLNVGFPGSYLANITVENNEKKRLKTTSGIPYIEKTPTLKEGGVEATFAVIKNLDSGEEFFKQIDGEIVNYNKHKILRVTHHPYPFVYQRSEELKQQGKRFGFNFQKNVVGDVPVSDGNGGWVPTVIKAHPDPNPAQEKNKEKNFKELISYAELTEAQKTDPVYAGIVELERKRQAEWQTIIAAYKDLSEEQAAAELIETFARRMSVCNYVQGEHRFKFLPLVPGLTFDAKISKYDIKPFEWDQEIRAFSHYTANTVNAATEVSEQYAKAILEAHKVEQQKEEVRKWQTS